MDSLVVNSNLIYLPFKKWPDSNAYWDDMASPVGEQATKNDAEQH